MPEQSFEAPMIVASGRKSAWNAYTMMLIVALVCLIIGMICLYLEVGAFGGFGAESGGPRMGWLGQLEVTRMV